MAYPVNLNVADKVCVVVGGGKVGARKARGLHAEGAQVTVISSSFYEQIDGVTYINARYDRKDLETLHPWLVVTCTDNHDTNAQIQHDADALGAIVMRADDSKAGDAHGVMKREQGALTVMLLSGVPTFSRFLLDEIETILTPDVAALAAELGEIRTELRQTLPTADERGDLWNAVESRYRGWLERLAAGETVDVRAEIDAILDELGMR